ncbi:hypothetical protein H2203_000774 [Taxawa tesnikishii (nom. ined.)]|nr:hypothetical protein H2203_000774 [Dothideales sp. JES 119]
MVILNGIYDRNWLGLAKRQDEAGIISKLLVLTLPALQAGISAIPIVLRSVTGQLILVNFTFLFAVLMSSFPIFSIIAEYVKHRRLLRDAHKVRVESDSGSQVYTTPLIAKQYQMDLSFFFRFTAIFGVLWSSPSPDFNPSNDVGYTLHRIPGVSPGLVAFLVFGTTASCRKRYREMFSGLCLWREQSAKTPDPMRRPSAPGWAAPADWGEKEQPERPELPVCPTRLGVLDDVEEYEMQVAHIERKKSHVAGRQDSVSVVHFACPKCVVEGISPV